MDNKYEHDGSLYGMTQASFEYNKTTKETQEKSSLELSEAQADLYEENKKTELSFAEAQAALYEEMQANTLAQMEANADIYETIIALGGNL